MSRGLYIGGDPEYARMERIKRQAAARVNRAVDAENRTITRGNRRRTFCIEKILEWCIKQNAVQARVWVTKLVSAGFDKNDGAAFEQMALAELETNCRSLLGILPTTGPAK